MSCRNSFPLWLEWNQKSYCKKEGERKNRMSTTREQRICCCKAYLWLMYSREFPLPAIMDTGMGPLNLLWLISLLRTVIRILSNENEIWSHPLRGLDEGNSPYRDWNRLTGLTKVCGTVPPTSLFDMLNSWKTRSNHSAPLLKFPLKRLVGDNIEQQIRKVRSAS